MRTLDETMDLIAALFDGNRELKEEYKKDRAAIRCILSVDGRSQEELEKELFVEP